MQSYLAKHALLPEGWSRNVQIDIDSSGIIQNLAKGTETQDAEYLDGFILPSMPNLHSHAFQRAFAGKSEFATADQDSFWTWRKLMYQFLETIDVDELENIATDLYREMVKAGYNHVGEFHYIHHRPDGTPYQNRAELSHAMVRAAKKAGIGITILPVLYAYSGFGNKPPEDGQKRFINSTDEYLEIIKDLHKTYHSDTMVHVGIAFHSLRAVSGEMIKTVCAVAKTIDSSMPIHIHIAEQQKEIDDCTAWSGKRPVEWLFENADINEHWCLVHATHMTAQETEILAKSKAVAGICPLTEANLGDGIFNMPAFIEHEGVWGIGSDSHISINMLEELRLFEYGQRLLRQQRAICRTMDKPNVGAYLYTNALKGGAQALGAKIGVLQKGYRGDFIYIEDPKNILANMFLDHLIFAGKLNIDSHYIGGKKR